MQTEKALNTVRDVLPPATALRPRQRKTVCVEGPTEAKLHGFSARREYVLKDGQTIVGGPDHYARLSAKKHLREFPARRQASF
jgi:hypothetical protein